jgi:hypothetical protein
MSGVVKVDCRVLFSSQFLFTYDSLELADMRSFEKSYTITPYFRGEHDVPVLYHRKKPTNGFKIVKGYCGMPIGVTVNGVFDYSMNTSTYKLIFKSLKPWDANLKRHDLANPNAKVGLGAVAGSGSKATLGISAQAGVVLIDNTLYKRLTLKDVGRRGQKGLTQQENKRLIWFLKPICTPQQDILDSLLEDVF